MLGVDQLTTDVKLYLINSCAPVNRLSSASAAIDKIYVRKKVTLALEADRLETVGRRSVLNHLTLNHTGEVRVTLVR